MGFLLRDMSYWKCLQNPPIVSAQSAPVVRVCATGVFASSVFISAGGGV
jgi:hypothetical protein